MKVTNRVMQEEDRIVRGPFRACNTFGNLLAEGTETAHITNKVRRRQIMKDKNLTICAHPAMIKWAPP